MAVAAVLTNTLPVEPPVWEMNSWFVTSNQKANFRGVILTFKDSLLLGAPMLKRFPLQIYEVQKRVEIFVFFGTETLKSEFEGSKPPKRHVYETEHVVWAIKRVSRSGIATCRRDEKTEKRKKKSHKTVIFHHCVEAPPVNRS